MAPALLVLAGCNQILGIGDFHTGDDAAPDGSNVPPDTVIGHSTLDHVTADAVVPVDEDLSTYTIQAYIPDAGQASGFRVVNGAQTTLGHFEIDDVPDGATYLLKLVSASGTPRFYVTVLHDLDLGAYTGGRPDATPVSLTQDVHLQITNMQSWVAGDFLVAESYNTSTECWAFDTITAPAPVPSDTALDTTFDWGNANACYSYRPDGTAALVTAAAGDALEIAHMRGAPIVDMEGHTEAVNKTIDLVDATDVTMVSGTPVTVSGVFAPVLENQTLRITFNRALFDPGFDPQAVFVPGRISASVYASNGIEHGIFVGPNIVGANFPDWSGTGQLVSTLDVPYGDSFPTVWPRIFMQEYLRLRLLMMPGTTVNNSLPNIVRTFRPFTVPVPPGPDLLPVSNVMIGGVPGAPGGRITLAGATPVHVSWNGVASATQYSVQVFRAFPSGSATGFAIAATIDTVETSVDLPSEVFSGGSFFAFLVAAHRNGTLYAEGHLRAQDFPYSIAQLPTGLFRIDATCGDAATQIGEDCDPGQTETAACDIDCSLPVCGDGLRNSAAGEVCDTVQNSFACDQDCTLPACGDGVLNLNVEDCEPPSGLNCNANCKKI